MRTMLGVIAVAAALVLPQAGAQARDVYPWCGMYGGNDGDGGVNCGFETLQQCQWALSGNGGYCYPSGVKAERPQPAKKKAAAPR